MALYKWTITAIKAELVNWWYMWTWPPSLTLENLGLQYSISKKGQTVATKICLHVSISYTILYDFMWATSSVSHAGLAVLVETPSFTSLFELNWAYLHSIHIECVFTLHSKLQTWKAKLTSVVTLLQVILFKWRYRDGNKDLETRF